MLKNAFLVLVLCLFLSKSAFCQTPSFVSDSISAYITNGLKSWNIPGLSIVIVKDGKVVLMKGYGVKSISGREPVDENTLFMIASNTKLFTATALSLLNFRKKLSLDDKIIKYYPDYRLYDPAVSLMVTIRDLLTHRIGTKTFQGDFTFWNTKMSRSQVMNKMRLLKPVGEFRQDYGYCNSCFLTAGQVIPKVTGKPWEVFVYDSIILPLEMNNTHMLSAGIGSRKNVALPYTTSYSGQLKELPYDQWDNLGPAASIVSSVHDLSHWLIFQLDSGRYNNKQVVPYAVLQTTRDLNIFTGSRKSAMYPINFRGYGLGVFGADYNGRQLYWHTGGAGGMVSNVCFVPDEKLGIAILTNNDNQVFFEALRYQVLDAYLGVPYVNRSSQQLPAFEKEMNQQLRDIDSWKSRVKSAAPPLPLTAYTGTFSNPLYGNIVVEQNDKSLTILFTNHLNLSATLNYMDSGEWLMQFSNIEYGIFPVKFNISGSSVTGISIRVNDYVESDPYLFEKSKL